MSAEEQTFSAADVAVIDVTPHPQEIAVQRHASDTAFLRQAGLALEAEATRRRNAGEAALDPQSAAAVVAALTA